MSKTTITKEALAQALKSLAKKKTLAKITIKDITDYCDISRNTFYYHFSDKYDLVNWIFTSETLPVINSFSEPERWWEGFVNLCRYLYENRDFYLDALQYIGQNSLREHLMEFYVELLEIHISTLYSRLGYKLAPDELKILARMQAHSYVGIILDWVDSGMQDNYLKYFEQLKMVNKMGNENYSLLNEMLTFSDIGNISLHSSSTKKDS